MTNPFVPDEEPPSNPDILVACPRCRELVVTVEMRLPATVYWRCVQCGHIFVQRLTPREDAPPNEGV